MGQTEASTHTIFTSVSEQAQNMNVHPGLFNVQALFTNQAVSAQ